MWDKIRVEGLKVLQRLIELPMPVVGVVNGLHRRLQKLTFISGCTVASSRESRTVRRLKI